jgi:ubiquinone/menaquinone biosynthesis C-methylase UbiE
MSENHISFGRYDIFSDVTSWDQKTAEEWAIVLRQRSEARDQREMRKKLIELAKINAGQTIAEIGSGTGALLVDLAHTVGSSGRVIGIEPQVFLAEVSHRYVKECNVEQMVSIKTESAERISLPANSVDICIAQTVLIHLPNEIRNRVLGEMCRIVQKDGKVISVDQDADTWIINHSDRRVTRKIIKFHTDLRFADGWTGRKLGSLFKVAGLRNVSVFPIIQLENGQPGYLYGMAKRIACAAYNAGLFDKTAYKAWIKELDSIVKSGEYFSSITYFIWIGHIR